MPAITEPRHKVVAAQFITLSLCLSFDCVSAIYLPFVTPLGFSLTGMHETVEKSSNFAPMYPCCCCADHGSEISSPIKPRSARFCTHWAIQTPNNLRVTNGLSNAACPFDILPINASVFEHNALWPLALPGYREAPLHVLSPLWARECSYGGQMLQMSK